MINVKQVIFEEKQREEMPLAIQSLLLLLEDICLSTEALAITPQM
jgi:hypothetical protein